MKKIKFTAAVLILLMFCTLLSGCGENISISKKLCNPNANEEAQKVYDYLLSVYGEKTLSGITSTNKEEYVVYKYTDGKRPAIMCLDMIHQVPKDAWHDSEIDEAIEWHVECNGIVELVWHWFAPTESTSKGGSFYTEDTDFMPSKALQEGTEENKWLNRDIETCAIQLQRLQEAGVPVLWRPFHEASGGWFWWGREGAEVYKELWNYLFEKLTYEYNLNNLIWVWNGQSLDWYVGDDKCDIASMDIYFVAESGNSPGTYYEYDVGKNHFDNTAMYTASYEDYLQFAIDELELTRKNIKTVPKKMVALSECDQIPDPDKMFSDESYAPWLWFAPWINDFSVTEKYTQFSMLYDIYNNEKVITLEDLPEWDDDMGHNLTKALKNAIERNGDNG